MSNLVEAQKELNAIAKKVLAELKKQGKSVLATGALLAEAEKHFAKASNFVLWAEEETGLRKASVYNYLRVHKEFGELPEAEQVPVNVLNTLFRADKSVLKQAKELLKEGEDLDEDGKQEVVAEVKELAEQEKAKKAAEKAEKTKPEGEIKEIPSDFIGSSPVITEDNNEVKPTEETKKLEKVVSDLQDQLTQALADLERSMKRPKLPQFAYDCPFAQLGLREDASVGQVRSAARALSTLFRDTNHAELIENAKDKALRLCK